MIKFNIRNNRGWSRLCIMLILIMMAICIIPAYGACSVCEDPNPDYDPTNPYESDPECIPKADGTVIDDCVSREEVAFASFYCISDFIVPPWQERQIGPTWGTMPVLAYQQMVRERTITYNIDDCVAWVCVTTSLVCENGSDKEVTDYPGDDSRIQVLNSTPTELPQSENFIRFWYGLNWFNDYHSPGPDPINADPCPASDWGNGCPDCP